MIGPVLSNASRLCAVVAFVGCGSAMRGSPASLPRPDEQNQVIVNGRAVHTGGHTSLLGLLRDHVSPLRLGIHATSVDELPLVVLAGVPLRDGFSLLSHLLLSDVASVTVLHRNEAVALWGLRASPGAIAVETKRGRQRDHAARWSASRHVPAMQKQSGDWP